MKKEIFKDVVFCFILFTLIFCALMEHLCGTIALGSLLIAFEFETNKLYVVAYKKDNIESRDSSR